MAERYALRLGLFEQEDQARELCRKAGATGLACTVWRTPDPAGREWWVAAAGNFESEAAALGGRPKVARDLGLAQALAVIALPASAAGR